MSSVMTTMHVVMILSGNSWALKRNTFAVVSGKIAVNSCRGEVGSAHYLAIMLQLFTTTLQLCYDYRATMSQLFTTSLQLCYNYRATMLQRFTTNLQLCYN